MALRYKFKTNPEMDRRCTCRDEKNGYVQLRALAIKLISAIEFRKPCYCIYIVHPHAPQVRRLNHRSRCGFSVLELLTVMGVIAVLIGMLVPAVSSWRGSGDLTKTVYDVSGLLEAARTQAMARNSYVWVGFASDQDASSAVNEKQLVVAVKTAPDGAKPPNLNAASLINLGKPQTFNNVQLSSGLGTYDGKKPVADKQLASTSSTDSFSASRNGVNYTFSKILEFNSVGEVRILNEVQPSRWIEIGLLPTHGQVVDTQGNSAALQIGGLTGQPRVFRP